MPLPFKGAYYKRQTSIIRLLQFVEPFCFLILFFFLFSIFAERYFTFQIHNYDFAFIFYLLYILILPNDNKELQRVEHQHWRMLLYPILSSQKITLSIIPYYFTIHHIFKNSLIFLLKYYFLIFLYYFFPIITFFQLMIRF